MAHVSLLEARVRVSSGRAYIIPWYASVSVRACRFDCASQGRLPAALGIRARSSCALHLASSSSCYATTLRAWRVWALACPFHNSLAHFSFPSRYMFAETLRAHARTASAVRSCALTAPVRGKRPLGGASDISRPILSCSHRTRSRHYLGPRRQTRAPKPNRGAQRQSHPTDPVARSTRCPTSREEKKKNTCTRSWSYLASSRSKILYPQLNMMQFRMTRPIASPHGLALSFVLRTNVAAVSGPAWRCQGPWARISHECPLTGFGCP